MKVVIAGETPTSEVLDPVVKGPLSAGANDFKRQGLTLSSPTVLVISKEDKTCLT